jgi:hypothetical protein
MLTGLSAPKYQDQVVGRHFDGLQQGQATARGQLFEIGDIAYAPFGVTLAQAGVEYGVA